MKSEKQSYWGQRFKSRRNYLRASYNVSTNHTFASHIWSLENKIHHHILGFVNSIYRFPYCEWALSPGPFRRIHFSNSYMLHRLYRVFAITLNDRQSSFSLDDTQHWQQLLSYVLFPIYNSSGVSCFTVKEWQVVSPHRPHILAHFLLSLKCGKCDTTVYSN